MFRLCNQTRTYGVEFEGIGATPTQVSEMLRSRGVQMGYGEHTKWRATGDGSLHDTTGRGTFELKTPILRGSEGFSEIRRVLGLVTTNLQVTVNASCGMHVHHGGADFKADSLKMRSLLALYRSFESVIDNFVAQSRRGNTASYAKSLINAYPWDTNSLLDGPYVSRAYLDPQSYLRRIYDRRVKVNLLALNKYSTVEFRQHQGSLDPQKACMWLILTQLIVETASKVSFIKPAATFAPTIDKLFEVFEECQLEIEPTVKDFLKARTILLAMPRVSSRSTVQTPSAVSRPIQYQTPQSPGTVTGRIISPENATPAVQNTPPPMGRDHIANETREAGLPPHRGWWHDDQTPRTVTGRSSAEIPVQRAVRNNRPNDIVRAYREARASVGDVDPVESGDIIIYTDQSRNSQTFIVDAGTEVRHIETGIPQSLAESSSRVILNPVTPARELPGFDLSVGPLTVDSVDVGALTDYNREDTRLLLGYVAQHDAATPGTDTTECILWGGYTGHAAQIERERALARVIEQEGNPPPTDRELIGMAHRMRQALGLDYTSRRRNERQAQRRQERATESSSARYERLEAQRARRRRRESISLGGPSGPAPVPTLTIDDLW